MNKKLQPIFSHCINCISVKRLLTCSSTTLLFCAIDTICYFRVVERLRRSQWQEVAKEVSYGKSSVR